MKKYLEYAGLVALVLLLTYLMPAKRATYGSATGYNSMSLTPSASTGDTYGLQVNGTTTVDITGMTVGPISSAIGTFTSLVASSFALGGGTAKTLENCATSSWNPASVSSSSAATIDVAASGYNIGDPATASLATSTQGLGILAISTSSATGTITAMLFLPRTSGGAIDIGTTTVQACWSH